MSRSTILWVGATVLALTWLGLWISGWWGTVTLEFENKPLGRVLDSFTQQTKLPVFTNLDRTKPVTIRVRRVTVTEALDAIQASADSRGGHLAFLLAPDEAGLARIRDLLPLPGDNSGILTMEFRIPFPAMAALEEVPQWKDPRSQFWQPTPNLPRQLQAAAENAAQATELSILLPSDWNPPIGKLPVSGKVSSSVPALAKLAGGKAQMLYVLPASPVGGEQGRDGSWGRDRDRRRTPSLAPEMWTQRLEPRLANLPKEEATAILTSIREASRQFQEWESLTREQRQEKVQAMMQDPATAERMSDRFSRGMRKLSPEQRAQRYKGYVERRAQAKSGQSP